MDFTVIGDAVSKLARYCTGATKAEVLISAEVNEWLWRILPIEPMTIETRQDGNFLGYRAGSQRQLRTRRNKNLRWEICIATRRKPSFVEAVKEELGGLR